MVFPGGVLGDTSLTLGERLGRVILAIREVASECGALAYVLDPKPVSRFGGPTINGWVQAHHLRGAAANLEELVITLDKRP